MESYHYNFGHYACTTYIGQTDTEILNSAPLYPYRILARTLFVLGAIKEHCYSIYSLFPYNHGGDDWKRRNICLGSIERISESAYVLIVAG